MPAVSPHLATVAALHAHLGIGSPEAAFLSKHSIYRYLPIEISKRRGGTRLLLVPDKRLRFLQRKLLELLEPLYVPRVAVHGFVQHRSALTNANVHAALPYMLNLDLREFFPSITRNRAKGVLVSTGVSELVAEAICNICTTYNQLPQGAPTSPLLSNMICFRLDRELTQFAKRHRLRYTRYADDITFSSFAPPTVLFEGALPDRGLVAVEKIHPDLRSIFAYNGFSLNPDKARFSDKKGRKEVTGLVVNEFTNVRRNFVRNLRATVYKIEHVGIKVAQDEYSLKFSSDHLLQKVVRGRLEWLAQVRGRSFGPYRTLANRYNLLFPADKVLINPTNEEVIRYSVFVIEYFHDLKSAQGTAFMTKDFGLVTAYHNLAGMPTEWATLYLPHEPAKKYKARLSQLHSDHSDVAILEHDLPKSENPYLSVAKTIDKVGSPVLAYGYPEFGPGDGLAQRQGHIVGRHIKSLVQHVEVDINLSDGLSGGPIVNDRFEVIGITHKGGPLENKQIATDISELDKLIFL